MYLSELKLWNFRKYGSDTFEFDNPDLIVPFNKGLNVLIGENDSGKTAIIDAIKLALKTHAYEWIKAEDSDFFNDSEKLRIELEFKGLRLRHHSGSTRIFHPIGNSDILAGKYIRNISRCRKRYLYANLPFLERNRRYFQHNKC